MTNTDHQPRDPDGRFKSASPYVSEWFGALIVGAELPPPPARDDESLSFFGALFGATGPTTQTTDNQEGTS